MNMDKCSTCTNSSAERIIENSFGFVPGFCGPTVFANVQLLQVYKAGNGGWQAGEVIVRHAEFSKRLTVK